MLAPGSEARMARKRSISRWTPASSSLRDRTASRTASFSAVLAALALLASCGPRAGGAVDTRYPPAPGGLVVAAQYGDNEVVRWFLEQGADVNGQDQDGNTTLHAAVDAREELTVKLLLGFGADPNVQNHARYTPAPSRRVPRRPRDGRSAARRRGRPGTIHNQRGETAGDIADRLGHGKVEALLRAVRRGKP